MKGLRQVWLVIIACIDIIMNLDKNHEVISMLVIYLLYEMMQYHSSALAPYIIAQIYHDLPNFVMV